MATVIAESLIKVVRSPLTFPLCVYTLILFSTQSHLLEVPIIRLYEQAICNRYYRTHGQHLGPLSPEVDESHCKIPAIQARLTTIVGWKIFFDAAPGTSQGFAIFDLLQEVMDLQDFSPRFSMDPWLRSVARDLCCYYRFQVSRS